MVQGTSFEASGFGRKQCALQQQRPQDGPPPGPRSACIQPVGLSQGQQLCVAVRLEVPQPVQGKRANRH